MAEKSTLRRIRALRPWIWLGLTAATIVGVLLTTVIIKGNDHLGIFFPYDGEAHTAHFAPYEEAPAEATSFKSQIAILAETDPSMAGFFTFPLSRSNCVFSSYQKLLENLEDELPKLSETQEMRYGLFNQSELKTDISMTTLFEQSTYEKAATEAPYGLLSALRQAEKNDYPTLIFTDLENDNLQDAQFHDVFRAIFEKDKTVAILRLYSSFGGILYDYLETTADVAYGVENPTPGQHRLNVTNQYTHRQPRAFYVLVVGTSAHCKEIEESLRSAYNELYVENIHWECGGRNHDLNDYQCFEEIVFETVLPEAILRRSSEGGDIQILSSEGCTIAVDSPWKNSHGVYQIEALRSLRSEDIITLQFVVHPALKSRWGLQFELKLPPTTAEFQVDKLIETRKRVADQQGIETKKNLLLARGDRVVELELQKNLTPKPEGLAAVQSVNGDHTSIDVAFRVNLSIVEAGLYRLRIPIEVLRDHSADKGALPMAGTDIWGFTSMAELAAVTKHIEDLNKIDAFSAEDSPAIKTLNIGAFLKQANDAYLETESQRALNVAEVIFDLEIK